MILKTYPPSLPDVLPKVLRRVSYFTASKLWQMIKIGISRSSYIFQLLYGFTTLSSNDNSRLELRATV